MSALSLLPLLLAGLTGCGGGSDAEVQPAATPSPTPTGKQATVQQWASLIAQQDQKLDETLGQWHEDDCSALSLDYPLCEIKFMTLGTVAKTLDIQLQGATSESSPSYLGEPPSEVATLVQETVDAAHEAATLADDPDVKDVGVAVRFEGAVDALSTAYAGWAPYL
jgi:hypothetical protein